MGECSFWYRPTRVVPDQRPLNGRCCCCCCWHDIGVQGVEEPQHRYYWPAELLPCTEDDDDDGGGDADADEDDLLSVSQHLIDSF